MNGERPPVVLAFPDGQERLVETPEEQTRAHICYTVPIEQAVAPGRTSPASLFMGSGGGTAVAVFFDAARADAIARLLNAAHVLFVMGSLTDVQREILKDKLEKAGFPV